MATHYLMGTDNMWWGHTLFNGDGRYVWEQTIICGDGHFFLDRHMHQHTINHLSFLNKTWRFERVNYFWLGGRGA